MNSNSDATRRRGNNGRTYNCGRSSSPVATVQLPQLFHCQVSTPLCHAPLLPFLRDLFYLPSTELPLIVPVTDSPAATGVLVDLTSQLLQRKGFKIRVPMRNRRKSSLREGRARCVCTRFGGGSLGEESRGSSMRGRRQAEGA